MKSCMICVVKSTTILLCRVLFDHIYSTVIQFIPFNFSCYLSIYLVAIRYEIMLIIPRILHDNILVYIHLQPLLFT